MNTALAGKRVLVVEDEALLAMMVEDILTDQGCIVQGPCANVSEAMAAIAETLPDLALLDVNLSGEKVFPVAEALEGCGVPFLLLSGYGSDAVPPANANWKSHGKPYKVDALLAAMTDLLN